MMPQRRLDPNSCRRGRACASRSVSIHCRFFAKRCMGEDKDCRSRAGLTAIHLVVMTRCSQSVLRLPPQNH